MDIFYDKTTLGEHDATTGLARPPESELLTAHLAKAGTLINGYYHVVSWQNLPHPSQQQTRSSRIVAGK
jgi:hypothetical protein